MKGLWRLMGTVVLTLFYSGCMVAVWSEPNELPGKLVVSSLVLGVYFACMVLVWKVTDEDFSR